jgi:hypothetical protein
MTKHRAFHRGNISKVYIINQEQNKQPLEF